MEAAVDRLLPMFLGRLIRRHSSTVTTARGKTYTLGDGSGPPVAAHFTSVQAQRAVILDPKLRLDEAYMDGTFVVERGTIAEVLEILFGQDLIAAPTLPRPP
jgi:cyclopropane-fatty-acyl-phospholipid synthase